MVFVSENLDFRLYVGRNLPFTKSLNENLKAELSKHFDFVVTPLFNFDAQTSIQNYNAHPGIFYNLKKKKY